MVKSIVNLYRACNKLVYKFNKHCNTEHILSNRLKHITPNALWQSTLFFYQVQKYLLLDDYYA